MELDDLRTAAQRLGFRARHAVRWLSPPTWIAVLMSRRATGPAPWASSDQAPARVKPLEPEADGSRWFDYVSDTGDGFEATATVAHALAAPAIELEWGGRSVETRRGALLVHGGDMAYPAGTDQVYRDRFIGPYAAMLPAADPAIPMVAIPGNHDLYDGLHAWARLMSGESAIGGWRTAQNRSWFFEQVSPQWWVLGVDMQRGGEIDDEQRAELVALATQMPAGSDVVVFVPEPAWFRARSIAAQTTHRWVTEELIGRLGRSSARLFVSGDLHHYSRYEAVDGLAPVDHITAGGGGAFLSSTHQLPVEADYLGRRIRVSETAIHPSRETSLGLRVRALTLPLRNRSFAAVTALAYAVIGFALAREPGGTDRSLTAALLSLGGLAVTAIVLFGAFAFAQRRTWQATVAAVLHASMHIGLAASATAIASTGRLGSAAAAAATGAVLGGFVVGVALIVSNLLGLNNNELFSAIRIDDYRCFLRFRVDADERLTVFPVAIDQTARRWRPNNDEIRPGWSPELVADDGSDPSLIEAPLSLEPTRD
ncbi:MAG: metallophosphoesterase family protein [Acidimicrobiales bacterium]